MAKIRAQGTDYGPSLTTRKRKRNKEMCGNDSRVAFTLLDITLILFEKKGLMIYKEDTSVAGSSPIQWQYKW